MGKPKEVASQEVILGATAIPVVHEKKKNLKTYIKFIERAAKKGVNFLVFPEASYQGYVREMGPRVWTNNFEEFEYWRKVAETVPGPCTNTLLKYTSKHQMYVQIGMIEESGYAGGSVALYNSAVLIGPEGVVGVFRKVHQPGGELHTFVEGREWPVFDTAVGRIGMLICYDQCFPEGSRVMAIKGADVLGFSTAWPSFSFGEKDKKQLTEETDDALYFYSTLMRCRALENAVWYVASNICGPMDFIGPSREKPAPAHFFGHSRIIAPNGRIVADTGTEPGIAIAKVDVKRGIVKARTLDFNGLNMLKDRKPATYELICSREVFYPPTYHIKQK